MSTVFHEVKLGQRRQHLRSYFVRAQHRFNDFIAHCDCEKEEAGNILRNDCMPSVEVGRRVRVRVRRLVDGRENISELLGLSDSTSTVQCDTKSDAKF